MRRAALTYALAWAAAGVAIALAAIAVIRALSPHPETVEVKPILQTDLGIASERAACRLLGKDDHRPDEPASSGRGTAPAPEPGVYDEPLGREAVIGALRTGLVVIHHRADLTEDIVAELRRVQEAVPEGTVVTPNRRMLAAAAATAWERALLCPRIDPATVDAVQLFRGRFLGARPEQP